MTSTTGLRSLAILDATPPTDQPAYRAAYAAAVEDLAALPLDAVVRLLASRDMPTVADIIAAVAAR
ncbi:MAG: hypothetical protein M0006_15405 [Magnetospirillum sp.]|nr:hypothetical protein [Magnetospirillum sp.]